MSPRDFADYLEDLLKRVYVTKYEEVIKRVFEEKKPNLFGFTAEDLINAFKEILSKPEVQEVI